MKPTIILPLLLILFLTACSISTTRSDANIESTELPNHIDPDWLSGNEAIISERIVSHIRKSHPVTDPEFPRLIIDKIQIENTADIPNYEGKIHKSFQSITDSVVENLLPSNSNANTWHAELSIAIRNPKLSKNEVGLIYAYMVPAAALCWGSAFIVCPVKETEIVVVELNIETDKKQHITIQGVGASTLYQQSVLANDSSDRRFTGHYERNTKAFVAAVADAVNKLILKVDEIKH